MRHYFTWTKKIADVKEMTINLFDLKPYQLLDKVKSLLVSTGFMPKEKVKTTEQLSDFISSNSAYVSQVTLYSYVKARAGINFPKLFSNEEYLTSLKIARWHIFGAAVCDLTLFSVAQLVVNDRLDPDQGRQLASKILNEILIGYPQKDVEASIFSEMCFRGEQRAKIADWQEIVTGPNAFQSSSDAVFKWAPIADELKVNDEEIVRNSIHLRWIGVRREAKELIDTKSIIEKMNIYS